VKPWHTPQPGHFWALTLGDVVVVARSHGDTFHVVQDSAPHIIAADAPLITDAEHIWPRPARKAA